MQSTRRELLCGTLAGMLALPFAATESRAAGQAPETKDTIALDLEPSTPLAPEYKQIVDDTQQVVELAFLKAAAFQTNPTAYPLPSDANSLERICLRFLENLQKTPSKAAKTAPQKAVQLLKSSKFSGKLSRVMLNSPVPVSVQARQQRLIVAPRMRPLVSQEIKKGSDIDDNTRYRLMLDAGLLRPSMTIDKLAKMGKLGGVRKTGTSTPATPSGATQLLLNLRSLKCRNLVNMELTDIGSNTMALGGLGSSSSGQELKISPFAAGTFERVNQTKNYNPDRTFARFDLTGNALWPRLYNVVIAAAEKDADGGFISFVHDLWDGVKEIVKELISAAVLAAATTGGAVGAVAGSAAPGVGTLIGGIIGAVLAGTIAFIVSVALDSLKDDLFDPISLPTFVLPDPTSRFANGGLKSNPFTVQLTQATALYELSCQWELVGV